MSLGAAPSLAPDLVEKFRPQLRGPLLLPGDVGFEDSRTVWNAMIQKRPAAIARCLGVADVVAGVRFAREHGVPLAIKGGGHNIAGLAVVDGGLVLDMGLMRGVRVEPATRMLSVQAGCVLGDVDRETQLHGLAATLGFVSNTGLAGLTLGGGIGYLSRRFGWTSDTATEMEVVTAEGRIVHASERENPDLFWGLRGGGGNFGIVTRFDFRMNPVGPEILGGAIAWRVERAADVLEAARRLMDSSPPELAIAMGLRPAPPAPWIAPDVHGRGIVALFVCWTGGVEAGEKLLAPIRALPGVVGDVLQRRTYVSQQNMLDATQPKGRRYYWKSEYLPGLDPAIFPRMIRHAGAIASPHSAILLFPLGEAIGNLPREHSAVGNRDARWLLNITGSWERQEEDAVHVEWARGAWRDMRSFSTGGTYINFLTEEEGGDRIESAYGGNLARLVEVKRTWDPGNLFRANKNIAP